MITTVKQYEEEFANLVEDFKNTVYKTNKTQPAKAMVWKLDKPVFIYTNNSTEPVIKLEDKSDHYQHVFPRFGMLHKTYTKDLAWVIDSNTIMYSERPYRGRVVKLLTKLLPQFNIRPVHNDIIINNYKIGPSLMCGQIVDMGDYENNPPTSSIVYCLRWSDVGGLDKYFAGDPNHEKRKASDTPLGSLDMFLKDITKEQFEQMLEDID